MFPVVATVKPGPNNAVVWRQLFKKKRHKKNVIFKTFINIIRINTYLKIQLKIELPKFEYYLKDYVEYYTIKQNG